MGLINLILKLNYWGEEGELKRSWVDILGLRDVTRDPGDTLLMKLERLFD